MSSNAPDSRIGLLDRWRVASEHYARFSTPRPDGLPRLRVLLALPAVLLVFGIIVVGFALNGTSSGAMYNRIYEGKDPSLIAGEPQLIRSDEWYVNTSWSISQVQQGLPDRNETMPGGMDAALPNDLPRADWSVIFRPHLWGYLVFDVGHATAFKWWISALSMIAAAYCFIVTLLPRRPILSTFIAIGFFFSPFFQWWFQSVIFWPMAWAFVTMTAMIWATRNRSWKSRWIWAALVAYLTVVMAMGIYAPYIVPVVLVVLFFAIGLVIQQKRDGAPWSSLLGQAIPVLAAGAVGAGITAIWLSTKEQTLNAFLATDYPGQRLTTTGGSGALSVARTISSSFTESLTRGAGFLGINSSESATFFLVGAFMIPIVAWVVYRSVKAHETLPWVLIGLTAVIALFAAFLYVPGWNPIAHLLFLDRTMDGRIRIGLGLASLAILVFVIQYLDEKKVKVGLALSVTTTSIFLLSQFGVAVAVIAVEGIGRLGHDAPFWWAFALASGATIYLFARRRPALGAAALFLVGVLGAGSVNPIYVGVFDLRTTPEARAVMSLDEASKGAWVGVGGVEVSAILLESGVEAFNGVQGAPSHTMWHEIDPHNKYDFNWNRLAGVGWIPGHGAPTVTNPAPDQILVSFDACSAFAQQNVDYVLSDNPLLKSPCLSPKKSFAIPEGTMTIYRVADAG